jgi:hypothetical protein
VAQPAAIATKSASALALNAVFFILESSFVGKTAGALFNKRCQAAMKTAVFVVFCRLAATFAQPACRHGGTFADVAARPGARGEAPATGLFFYRA